LRNIEIRIDSKNDTGPGLGAARANIKKFAANSIGDFRKVAASVAGLREKLIGLASSEFVQTFVNSAKELMDFETKLTTATGTVELAHERLKELREISKTTTFALPGLVEASASLEGFGDGALASGEGFRMIGDIAAATNSDLGDLSGAVGALYGAVQNNQSIEDSVEKLQEMGVVSGQAAEELVNLQQSGASGSMVWSRFRAQMGSYTGGMQEVAQTTEGQMEVLKNSWEDAKREIAEASVPALNEAIQAALDVLTRLSESGDLAKWGAQIGAALSVLVERLSTLVNFAVEHQEMLKTLGMSLAAYRTASKAVKGFEVLQKSMIGAKLSATSLNQALGTMGGALGTVAAVAAVAFIGWQVGKVLGELLGMDEVLYSIGERLKLLPKEEEASGDLEAHVGAKAESEYKRAAASSRSARNEDGSIKQDVVEEMWRREKAKRISGFRRVARQKKERKEQEEAKRKAQKKGANAAASAPPTKKGADKRGGRRETPEERALRKQAEKAEAERQRQLKAAQKSRERHAKAEQKLQDKLAEKQEDLATQRAKDRAANILHNRKIELQAEIQAHKDRMKRLRERAAELQRVAKASADRAKSLMDNAVQAILRSPDERKQARMQARQERREARARKRAENRLKRMIERANETASRYVRGGLSKAKAVERLSPKQRDALKILAEQQKDRANRRKAKAAEQEAEKAGKAAARAERELQEANGEGARAPGEKSEAVQRLEQELAELKKELAELAANKPAGPNAPLAGQANAQRGGAGAGGQGFRNGLQGAGGPPAPGAAPAPALGMMPGLQGLLPELQRQTQLLQAIASAEGVR
jgi:hypothetical protein